MIQAQHNMSFQKNMSIYIKIYFFSIALLLMYACTGFAIETLQPNIVIIYGDDVGFGDISVNGSKKIITPNIDKLASEGINFTNGHSTAATCTPSRYSMLVGRYAFRQGISILPPDGSLCLSTDELTLPKLLKKAGYYTGVIGKWHLGLGHHEKPLDLNDKVQPGPLEVGFDYSYLLPVTNDRVPCVYLEGHDVVGLDPNDPLFITKSPKAPAGFKGTVYPIGTKDPRSQTYYTASDHAHSQSVINGISRMGYQWGGNSALWNDETMADHFVEKTRSFIKEHKDKPFFLYFASQDIHVPRAPHPRFHGKTELGKRGDAMIQFDWTTGAIMDALEEQGLTENTIVILSSDNGPVYNDGYNDGSNVKRSSRESDNGHDGSGPYTGGKYQIYDGGTRVPFIVRWPKRIQPARSDALVCQIDFIASFAKLLNLELKDEEAPDSRDHLKALLGESTKGHPHMLTEAPGVLAVRQGKWKYIEYYRHAWTHRKTPGTRELYNLDQDVAEKSNVLDQHPEVVETMSALLKKIRSSSGIRQL